MAAMTPSQKEYYERNKALILANRKEYYRRNREKCLAKEREKLELLKQDPEAYKEFCERRMRNYQARRAAGKIPPYREIKQRWADKNIEYNRKRTRDRRNQARHEAIVAYGGRCACCGESRKEFLAIDHVHGGGHKHRQSLRPTDRREFCTYIKKLGYPPEYRLLCHNCNLSRGLYGYCPHEGVPEVPPGRSGSSALYIAPPPEVKKAKTPVQFIDPQEGWLPFASDQA